MGSVIEVEGLEKHFGRTRALAGTGFSASAGPSWPCSGRTAPARRPRCGCSPP